MRDVLKQAENGRKQITYNRNLRIDEVNQIYSIATAPQGSRGERLYDTIMTAFYMGVAVGIRQEKDRRKAADK